MEFLKKWRLLWLVLILLLFVFGVYHILSAKTNIYQKQLGSIIITLRIKERDVSQDEAQYYKQLTLQDEGGNFKFEQDEILSSNQKLQVYLLIDEKTERFLVIIDEWHCYYVFNIMLAEMERVNLPCDASIEEILYYLGPQIQIADEVSIGE